MNLRAFWARRARRILPALAAPALFVIGFGAATGNLMRPLLDVAVAPVANYAWWSGDQLWMWRHTWSLAVEEQFYLVWPLLVVALWRLGVARRAVVAAAVAFAAWRLGLGLTGHFGWGYKSLDGNAYALLGGAALALVRPRLAPRWAGVGAVVLLVAGVLLGAMRTESAIVGPAFGPVVAAASVVLVAGCTSLPMLRWGPLRWLGAVSYGWYLWHFPMADLLPPGAARWMGFALTLGLAAVSWRFLERPILERGRRNVQQRPARLTRRRTGTLWQVGRRGTGVARAPEDHPVSACVGPDDSGEVDGERGRGRSLRDVAVGPARGEVGLAGEQVVDRCRQGVVVVQVGRVEGQLVWGGES